jgi:coenzyme F420-reducing hydrogenase delta subunit
MRPIFQCAAVAAVLCSGAANAAETIVFKYDARGRLTRVERSGSVNNNVVTTYSVDKADNRTNKTITGSPNPPPP